MRTVRVRRLQLPHLQARRVTAQGGQIVTADWSTPVSMPCRRRPEPGHLTRRDQASVGSTTA
jgi:hypothetical protein